MTMSSSAGYSGTPLIKKLGIKKDFNVGLVDPPDNYFELLGVQANDLAVIDLGVPDSCDFIHLFTTQKEGLLSRVARLKPCLLKNGMLWISWPKGKSKIPKDIGEADVRSAGLGAGLVDIKICAVDEDWSGLKFVFRKKDR